ISRSQPSMHLWMIVVRLALPSMLTFLGMCGGALPAVVTARTVQPANRASVDLDAASIDLWVDPLHGSDAADGASRATALRTITAAWQRIPAGTQLQSSSYRILLVAGDYAEGDYPVYWEDRHGT